MSKKLIEKLSSISKQTTNDEHGFLKKLLNKVIFENNLEDKLAYLITLYDRRRDVSKKKTKSVIVNHLTDKAISFKTLVFIIFEVLRAKKMTISITIDWGKKQTTHTVDIRPESEGQYDEVKEDDRDSKTKS